MMQAEANTPGCEHILLRIMWAAGNICKGMKATKREWWEW